MYVLVLATIALILSILEYQNKIDKKWCYAYLALVSIVLMIRYPMGCDIFNYQNDFNLTDTSNWLPQNYSAVRKSYFYFYIGFFTKLFGGTYTTFLFVLNIIDVSLISYTIYKNSKNICGSTFLFLSTGYTQVYLISGIRQGLAMALFIFGYFNYLKKDKYVGYLIFVLLACLSHGAGLLGIPILIIHLLLNKFEILKNKKIVIGLGLISIICALFPEQLFNLLTTIFSFALSSYADYISQISVNYVGIALRVVLMAGIYVIYLGVDKDKKQKYTNTIYIYYLFTIAYIAVSFIDSLSRVNDFFAIVEFVTVPNMISEIKIKDKLLKIFVSLALVGYVSVNYVMLCDDINFHTSKINQRFGSDLSLTNYPLYTIFPYLESDGAPY